ncbi:hypothetical protein FACS189419_08260 [Planctomycetales bacterium]|nr:hypothetical protein FACS189419_08260 [Planctomycetales bacterium]
MNSDSPCYRSFALVKEMLETAELISNFDFSRTKNIADAVKKTGKLFLSGEGSSRIFPAKSFIDQVRRANINLTVATEGSRQAAEYDLSAWTVIVTSNSGQTAEAVPLLSTLEQENHPYHFAVTANPQAKLLEFATEGIVLTCGKEQAVAATKSVVEQALVYWSLLPFLTDCCCPSRAAEAGEEAKNVMSAECETLLVKQLAGTEHIYFAGRNDGVAEELALKTIEITRKKSSYFEGTYLLHGVEEMIAPTDALVLIDPFEAEIQRIKERYVDALNIPVVVIAPQATVFPTLVIPSVKGYDTILQLLAGWNLLVQIGVENGLNIDKPVRARKIGNEYSG